jgi:hypothetical protein
MVEVASIQEIDQMQPGKSQFMCGFACVMMALSMAPYGHRPILSTGEVISKMEEAYAQYDGSNDSANMDGMSVQQEYDLLHQVGLHYQAIALDSSACVGWLQSGYPVSVACAEASVVDSDLGGNPYPWGAAGNHVILLTGLDGQGNYLVRDSANCTDLYDPNSLRPGPRRYVIDQLQLVSATVIVPPWLTQPESAIPPSQGGKVMPDTTNQMIVDMYSSMETFWQKVYGTPLPKRGSGIFNSAYHSAQNRGVPLGPEYPTVDTRGVAVVAQNWSGGVCHWYPLTGVAVWL